MWQLIHQEVQTITSSSTNAAIFDIHTSRDKIFNQNHHKCCHLLKSKSILLLFACIKISIAQLRLEIWPVLKKFLFLQLSPEQLFAVHQTGCETHSNIFISINKQQLKLKSYINTEFIHDKFFNNFCRYKKMLISSAKRKNKKNRQNKDASNTIEK